jgi:hypothetical protein
MISYHELICRTDRWSRNTWTYLDLSDDELAIQLPVLQTLRNPDKELSPFSCLGICSPLRFGLQIKALSNKIDSNDQSTVAFLIQKVGNVLAYLHNEGEELSYARVDCFSVTLEDEDDRYRALGEDLEGSERSA